MATSLSAGFGGEPGAVLAPSASVLPAPRRRNPAASSKVRSPSLPLSPAPKTLDKMEEVGSPRGRMPSRIPARWWRWDDRFVPLLFWRKKKIVPLHLVLGVGMGNGEEEKNSERGDFAVMLTVLDSNILLDLVPWILEFGTKDAVLVCFDAGLPRVHSFLCRSRRSGGI